MASNDDLNDAFSYVFLGGSNQDLDREPTPPFLLEDLDADEPTPPSEDTADWWEDAEVQQALRADPVDISQPLVLDQNYWIKKRKRDRLEGAVPAAATNPLPPAPTVASATTNDETKEESDDSGSGSDDDSDASYNAPRKRQKTASTSVSTQKPSEIIISSEELKYFRELVPKMSRDTHGNFVCPVPDCLATLGERYTLGRHLDAHRPPTTACAWCGLPLARDTSVKRHQEGKACPKRPVGFSGPLPQLL